MSEVCSRKRRKTTTNRTSQEMLEWNAVHDVHDERITITIDSGAAVSAVQEHAAECAAERDVREQDLPSGKCVQNQKSWRKENHVDDDQRIYTVDEFQDCRRDKGVSVRKQDDMSEEAAVSHERRKPHREQSFWKETAPSEWRAESMRSMCT